jgi:hypothetical protein
MQNSKEIRFSPNAVRNCQWGILYHRQFFFGREDLYAAAVCVLVGQEGRSAASVVVVGVASMCGDRGHADGVEPPSSISLVRMLPLQSSLCEELASSDALLPQQPSSAGTSTFSLRARVPSSST